MLWRRLILGDEGKVWYKRRGGRSTQLSYDEAPLSYVLEVGFSIFAGLFFVWLALGDGNLKKKP
jgi:hypothetical protein